MTHPERNLRLWEAHMKQWNLLGPPLRPAAEDLRLFEDAIGAWSASRGNAAATALVLGVTPEFPALRWPAGSRVFAADGSEEMISFIWYRSALHAAGAFAARWQSLPLADASMDILLGDGCFTLSAWPSGYEQLCASIARVLRPGGRVIMRFHVRPGEPESPEAALADLVAGRCGGFNAGKWRLLVALHGRNPGGVRLGDVWEFWRRQGIDEEDLASRTGWELSIIRTIDAYRDKDIVYFIPCVPDLRQLLARHFDEIACHRPGYDSGDLYRVMTLERREPSA